MSLAVGSQVAQYRLERRLGAGGMGEVYLAHDSRLDRSVAIKFLVAPADPQARRRLLHEARAVAALDHPGICAVYEVGTDPSAGDFIAMQYIEGDTLGARLRRGRLRADEALSLGGHVAEALISAHRRGVIHRDLKPQNIMLTPSGAPKLLDFGLATHAPDTAAAANADTTLHVTDPHIIAGTPAYMSPEQARNESVDARADVFALGCVLYECLTGRRAFSGASTAETLGQVLHVDPPAVSSLVPDVGPAYDGLCARLLHKIPDERFQSAEEVLGAIRALTPSTRLSASTSRAVAAAAPRESSRRMLLIAAAIAVVGFGGYTFWPRGSALPVPSPDALRWYNIGTEAMRDGAYGGARTAFLHALEVSSSAYPQAYWRLAEANIALEDERGATEARLRGEVPDPSRLQADDRLRYEAARGAALRQHDAAIRAYRELADRQVGDAGRWLDVGRAQEAGAKLDAAKESYAKALLLDSQSPAAHLRSGVLMARMGKAEQGLAHIEEAIGLYRAAERTEGEAEALLRKGLALISKSGPDAAQAFEAVVRLSTDGRYPSQRVGAEFGLARLDYKAGAYPEAERRARQAVDDAEKAGLPTLAASGLLALGNALLGLRLNDAADAAYVRAVNLAANHGASRTEMVATLQRASLLGRINRLEEATRLATRAFTYFTESGEAIKQAEAKLILSRVSESLEQYDEARRLAGEALTFAETAKEDGIAAQALENLAGQSISLGRWPEALVYREKVEATHRRMNDLGNLPYDLANHAELLVLLGRGQEAEPLLQEVEKALAKGGSPYWVTRVGLLRVLRDSTELHGADALKTLAAIEGVLPKVSAGAKAPYTRLLASVHEEYARASLKRGRTPASVIASWPAECETPRERRELSYWVAQTLLARGEPRLARQVAGDTLAEPAAQVNPELAWRLAAIAVLAENRMAAAQIGASMAPLLKTSSEQIAAAWAGAATTYFARPDLAELRKGIR